MLRAIEHCAAGHWPAELAADAVTLDFDGRHRRRIRLTSDAGRAVLLDLPKAVAMADGDGLRLAEGGWLRVRAAAEPLMEVRCAQARRFVRVAWHLGNRHLPTEILDDALRIRPDHVIETMLRRLGAEVTPVTAPFQPEGGAYGSAGGHAHGHGQPHDHAHAHAHAHAH